MFMSDPAIPRTLRPLGDFSAMTAALARASQLPLETVASRLRRELDALGQNVCDDLAAYDARPYEWSDALAEFYERTSAFLFESLAWNDMPTKQAMRNWIVAYLRRTGRANQRVLCCGDGLGFDSTALALAGAQAAYFEVSSACRKFAAEVFATNGAQVEMLDSLAAVDEGSFDVVVCLDVLEHVPSPSRFVGELARLIRPGGLLVSHAPFWLLDAATPTHLRENLQYSGDWRRLYGAHGLRPIAGRYFWNPIVLQKEGGAATSGRLRDRVIPTCGGVWLKLQRLWPAPMQLVIRRMLKGEQRARRKALLGGSTTHSAGEPR